MTTRWPEMIGPQCQHVESGRCGTCAYPTMAKRLRYVEGVKTEAGKEAAYKARLAERRRVTGGGRKHRKTLRLERIRAMYVNFPRRVTAVFTGR